MAQCGRDTEHYQLHDIKRQLRQASLIENQPLITTKTHFNMILASSLETYDFLHANNECADQPLRPCSLIRAFVFAN